MTLDEIFKRIGHKVTGAQNIFHTQPPRDYQEEDLSKVLSWPRSAIYSEVGTGKSNIAFMYITHKILEGHKVVVIMPPTLIPQFISEFEEKIVGHKRKALNLTIPKARRDKLMAKIENGEEDLPDVVFLSYLMFTKLQLQLSNLGYTCLVADESHNACNVATKNFKSIWKFLYEKDGEPKEGTTFLSMTATPCPTELRSSFGHIRLRIPSLYKSQAAFDREHVMWHEYTDFPKIVGYKNKDILKENMNRFSVRRRSRDVLDLKEPNVIEHKIYLSVAHLKLYKTLLKEMIIELGDEIIDGTNPSKLRVLALMLITRANEFTESEIEDLPLANLKEIVDSLAGEKLLVFCHFRSTVEGLAEEFKELNPALMYGGSNTPLNVEKFNKDPTCKIAFLNYRSGGAGLNLQYECHNTVFYESTGSPAQFEQAVGRTHRSGQTEVCNVWLFRYVGTLSARLIDSALGRSKDIKHVMKDKAALLDALDL